MTSYHEIGQKIKQQKEWDWASTASFQDPLQQALAQWDKVKAESSVWQQWSFRPTAELRSLWAQDIASLTAEMGNLGKVEKCVDDLELATSKVLRVARVQGLK